MLSFKHSVVGFDIFFHILVDISFILSIYVGILKHAMSLMLTVIPVWSNTHCIKKITVDQRLVTLQGNLYLKQPAQARIFKQRSEDNCPNLF